MNKKLNLLFEEFEFAYFRSSGPGGQNVNKTNSAASLRWNISSSRVFSEEEKTLLLMRLKSQLTLDGDVLIRSSEHRQQESNKSASIDKFFALIKRALHVPKVRRKTRPTRSSVEKRHVTKKSRGDLKKGRQKIKSWE